MHDVSIENERVKSVTPPFFPAAVSDTTRDQLKRVFEAAAEHRVVVAVDLDGATLVREPAIHADVPREDVLADSLMTIANFCPAGPITGRPFEFVKGALSGLIGENAPPYAFAITEAGAYEVNSTGDVVFCKKVDGLDELREVFSRAVEELPGAVIEEHTLCSLIVGLTKVNIRPAQEVLEHMEAVAKSALNGHLAGEIVSGCHPGINVHLNLCPPDIHKGHAMQRVMDMPSAKDCLPVVIGDSAPDGEMFKIAERAGGVSIGVGPGAPAATIHVNDYREAQAIVAKIATSVRTRIPAQP